MGPEFSSGDRKLGFCHFQFTVGYQTIYNQLQWDETLATTYDLGWCSTLNPATHPTVPPHPVATSCGSRARWPSAASLICSSKILWQGQCFRSQWNFDLWFRHSRWTRIISYQCTTISCNIMGRCVTITSNLRLATISTWSDFKKKMHAATKKRSLQCPVISSQ